jgi:hypothetical protein
MRYLCCNCEKESPSNQAVDGFRSGYVNGFLCPHCDSNIQEAPLTLASANVVFGKAKYLALAFAFFGLSSVAFFRAGFSVSVWELHVPIWVIVGCVSLVAGAIAAVKYPAVVFNPLNPTKRVVGSTPDSTKVNH